MTEPKVVSLIKDAKALKAQMNELKEASPELMRYLELEDERRDIHKQLTGHIDQYNVNADLYKKFGLIGRLNRSVKVGDIETLVAVKPKLRAILLPLINESQSYYT
jgi:hypothetical protein